MKKLFFLLLLTISFSAAYGKENLIIVASGTEHPMYSIASVILPEAYSMIGYRMTISVVPPIRALAMFNNGKADGYIFSDPDFLKEHPGSIMVKTPLGYDEFAVFTVKADFIPDGWKSLRPYSIGYIYGMIPVEKNLNGMRIDGSKSRIQAFSKMMAGRTDIVVLPRYLNTDLRRQFPQIRILLPVLGKVTLYTFLTGKRKDIAQPLADALLKLKADGRLKEVTDKIMAGMQK